MSRKEKQLTIYPSAADRRIVGGNTPACNRAIACWAMVLRQHMPRLSREEWNFLADALNGSFKGDLAPGVYDHGPVTLKQEVHDAQALNGTGDKWFGDPAEPGSGQKAVDALSKKLAGMSWEQIQYIRTAANFFWSPVGLDAIEHGRDEWWTVGFRVRILQAAEEKQPSA